MTLTYAALRHCYTRLEWTTKYWKCIVWGISGTTDFYLQKRSLAMQMCLKNVMQLASNAALQKGTFLLFHKDHKHKVPCNLSHIEKRHFISGRNNIACMVQQPLWLILEEVIAKLVNIFLPLCASERMRKQLKQLKEWDKWKWLHVHNLHSLENQFFHSKLGYQHPLLRDDKIWCWSHQVYL